jgi:hypothetical protein
VIVAQPVTGNFQDDGANGFPPGSNGNPWQWGGTTDFSFIPTPPTSPNGVQSGESLTIGFDLLVSYADLINSFTNPPLGATRVGLHLQSIGANDNFSEGMYATVVPIPGALPLMLGGLLGLGVLARRRIGT